MASIMDIGPLSASVTLRGKAIDVTGIGADALVLLLDLFPDMYKALGMRKEMDASDFIKLGPDIVCAVIAVGTGMDVKKESVDQIRSLRLTIGEQMETLSPILRMTFPQGFHPFVDALSEVVEGAGQAGLSGKAPASS